MAQRIRDEMVDCESEAAEVGLDNNDPRHVLFALSTLAQFASHVGLNATEEEIEKLIQLVEPEVLRAAERYFDIGDPDGMLSSAKVRPLH